MINGKLIKEENLLIPAKDLGLLRGFAVFDFLVTYKNRPFLIDAHFDRLFNSAATINLHHSWTKTQVEEMVHQTITANPIYFEKTIKIVLTGGISPDGFTPKNKTTLMILIDQWKRLPQRIYKNGSKIITNYHKRYLPESKTNCYIEALKNYQRIQEEEAFEILYYDNQQVYECSRSNIFAVIGGKLLTPKDNVLKGITRKVVLEKLRLPIPVVAQNFKLDDLRQAEEVFITKSNDEIVPVVKVDKQAIGNGIVGMVTKQVMREFLQFTQSDIW